MFKVLTYNDFASLRLGEVFSTGFNGFTYLTENALHGLELRVVLPNTTCVFIGGRDSYLKALNLHSSELLNIHVETSILYTDD